MRYQWLILFLLLGSCSRNDSDNGANNLPDTFTVRLTNAFPELRFSRPLDVQSPDDGTNRIFVVEQRGRILVFPNETTVPQSTVFLDIGNRVDDSENEMGLLGMVFHPDFATNGYFYVYYNTSRNTTVVSRFSVMETDANNADANSEVILLQIPQPFTNHNGGQLAFGPDGFLYIAVGDGGSGGDPQGNAQNRENLLGSILRIDVNGMDDGLNYAIPPDNPYAESTVFRREIFAYGLRNPWRMSFDVETAALWAGDVGQGELEEIDIIQKGANYGWNFLEGTACFSGNECDTESLVPPVFEYTHNAGDVSITGGYVYRGSLLPQLRSHYIYADFVSGRIWALAVNGTSVGNNELLLNSGLNISSFGTDNQNELYICSFDGAIYRLNQETK
ncbi:PQQ-dependent sugar dehydrogenase [Arenibacter sp. GZD96]|uniref:PQQ-dependent sugar dehydrogenase n=1 Tax=Aurantibrevibacter litoralis TaxID=3106030 RepID=UPI002AFE66D0|nr:PQQ-dependent sugar dehydrogenase [Arenibacter sp. GZD-96]MEA1784948.1 PQQ-dependent sugar dehydrogenase [Arenibacter sp. GZD-96]